MSYAGDWMCGSCQHVNFKKRDSCQRCGYSKFGGRTDVTSYEQNRTEVLAGDWYCAAMNCGAHNYARRTNCYRCGASNMMTSGCFGDDSNPPPGWKTGDWICTG
ncbi:hypothetical protein L1049_000154 [Liquidambar formosana]|uniref:RanBP2-type domain-containing protein n=1 Tax=Liquidambar formosana TaxID=63359 RepID=A0AAP0NBU3_LIQFO